MNESFTKRIEISQFDLQVSIKRFDSTLFYGEIFLVFEATRYVHLCDVVGRYELGVDPGSWQLRYLFEPGFERFDLALGAFLEVLEEETKLRMIPNQRLVFCPSDFQAIVCDALVRERVIEYPVYSCLDVNLDLEAQLLTGQTNGCDEELF